MTRPILRKASNQNVYLHVWRSGSIYELAKNFAFLDEWNGVSLDPLPHSSRPDIVRWKGRPNLPFPQETFDAIYVNRILEHFTFPEGERLLRMFFDLLKPSGTLRVVVPNLEGLARDYLQAMDAFDSDSSEETYKTYELSVLDLLDQMVRERSGGRLFHFLQHTELDKAHAQQKMGDVWHYLSTPPRNERSIGRIFTLLKRKLLLLLWRQDPRRTREAHRWMHDQLSLRQLLEDLGFLDVSVVQFNESRIPSWSRYNFDSSDRGSYPLEPSLYVEAQRPT